MEKYKAPISVLVVVYTPDLQVLLLERADHPGYWQSITGSQDQNEALLQTAARETTEETGIDATNFLLTDLNFINKYFNNLFSLILKFLIYLRLKFSIFACN